MYQIRYFSEMLNANALFASYDDAEQANRAAAQQRAQFLRWGQVREAKSVEVKYNGHNQRD